MKFNKWILFPTIILITIGILGLFANYFFKEKGIKKFEIGKFEAKGRAKWEISRLIDPETGIIPEGMRAKELAFSLLLPKDADFITNHNKSSIINWVSRGPWNVGGRTRALAIDIDNENIVFSGSVSGGLWRSIDGGNTWLRVTTPEQNFGLTSIVQDKRAGKHNIWYFSTGEPYGTSASGQGSNSFYLGNGIYKSIDNGLTWTSLTATTYNSPQNFRKGFHLIWNMTTDPINISEDIVYAATYGNISRSINGGNTWTVALGGSSFGAYSYFTDIAITSTGILYATLSSDGPKKGIWRSVDGINWIKISPLSWSASYNRIAIGISPSDENTVYFLAETPGSGQRTTNFMKEEEWNSLWRYTYISGDGSDIGGSWADLSLNLPSDNSQFGQFNAQGGYNLHVYVKPNNPNIVFIGGTNLFRSTDGFNTPNNVTQIGGYGVGTSMPYFQVYPNQHPDQHRLVFLPSNPDIMLASTDGGLHKTNNNLAANVIWSSLNKGYLSSQFYTLGIDYYTAGNDIIVGGMQDNGTYFTNSASPTAQWAMPSTGDGAFCAVDNSHINYYFSRQSGKMLKMQLDEEGIATSFQRIDPIGGKGYLFINPFILDPINSNIMYLAGGKELWRNNDLSNIAFNNNYDSINTNWTKIIDSVLTQNLVVTALAASHNNPRTLYFGTATKKVFRLNNADSCTNCTPIDITPTYFPSAYVSCIAVDPRDADKAMVVFSNYSVYSLYFTRDGGVSWEKAGGNIEQYTTGLGNGPSCRWAAIQPIGNKTAFWLATSVGLFATDTLKGDSTRWVQLAYESIGNTVVDMVTFRPSDGLVVVATHGNGIFSTYITDVGMLTGTSEFETKLNTSSINVSPNPFSNQCKIALTIPEEKQVQLCVYDINGNKIVTLVSEKLNRGIHYFTWDGSIANGSLVKNGIYLISYSSGKDKLMKKVVLLR